MLRRTQRRMHAAHVAHPPLPYCHQHRYRTTNGCTVSVPERGLEPYQHNTKTQRRSSEHLAVATNSHSHQTAHSGRNTTACATHNPTMEGIDQGRPTTCYRTTSPSGTDQGRPGSWFLKVQQGQHTPCTSYAVPLATTYPNQCTVCTRVSFVGRPSAPAAGSKRHDCSPRCIILSPCCHETPAQPFCPASPCKALLRIHRHPTAMVLSFRLSAPGVRLASYQRWA